MKTFEEFYTLFINSNPDVERPGMKEIALMGYTWAMESVAMGASSRDLLASAIESLGKVVPPQ